MLIIKNKTVNLELKNKFRIIFQWMYGDGDEYPTSEIIVEKDSIHMPFIESCILKIIKLSYKKQYDWDDQPKWLQRLEDDFDYNMPTQHYGNCMDEYPHFDGIEVKYYDNDGIEFEAEYIPSDIKESFLFTGKLNSYTRKEAEDLIQSKGYNIATSVNKNLTYLVVGEKHGTKYDKAIELGTVIIMDEDEFDNFINEIK